MLRSLSLATTCYSGRTSAAAAPVGFVLALLVFFSIMFRTLGKDDPESVKKVGVLIVQTATDREVCPLHPLAQREHANDGMSVDDSLAPNKLASLFG